MYVIHRDVADPDSPVATERLNHDKATNGEDVRFNPDTGKAQVTRAIGEQLCDHYDAIVPAEGGEADTDDND